MPTDQSGPAWDVRDDPTGVTVRNARNPLGPALRFTHDQWTDLFQTVAANRPPDDATKTHDGHTIKFAVPGQEDDALSLWLGDLDTFTHDILNGRYGAITPQRTSTVTAGSGGVAGPVHLARIAGEIDATTLREPPHWAVRGSA